MVGISYAIKAYVDLDNDGDFSEPEEDISAYLIEANGQRGRTSVNDEYAPSSASLLLDNSSGDLSFENVSSPYYRKLFGRVAVKVEVEYNLNTYPLFFGFINEASENRPLKEINTIELQCLDAFEHWRFGTVRINLLENKRVDELIDAVLDEIQAWGAPWPVSLRDLDVSFETIERFWQHRAKPVDALRTAARQELAGHLFIGKAGEVVFRNRWWRASQSLFATISPTGDLKGRAFQINARGEDLIDAVEYTRAGLDVDGNTTVLYTLTPVGRQFQPGSTHPANTLNGQYAVGGKDVVEPVATTDWTFNSEPDGSGTDKTAQVEVADFTSFGGGFQIKFNVLDSSPVYIQLLQVRGKAVRRTNDERLIRVEAPAPLGTEQVLQKTFDFNDNVDNISAAARLEAATMSVYQPKPPIIVTAENGVQFVALLSADIGTKFRLIDNTGPQHSDIDAYFMVEQYQWKLAPKKLPYFSFQLWHIDQSHGNLFRVSPDAPASILSSIATDAATEYDRIGV